MKIARATTRDLKRYEVRIHGTLIPIETVESADEEAREVWCDHPSLDPARQLKTGTVTITDLKAKPKGDQP